MLSGAIRNGGIDRLAIGLSGLCLVHCIASAVLLTMLVIVYVFNFLDRQIVTILAEPIKVDLQLSDTQIGLMTGLVPGRDPGGFIVTMLLGIAGGAFFPIAATGIAGIGVVGPSSGSILAASGYWPIKVVYLIRDGRGTAARPTWFGMGTSSRSGVWKLGASPTGL